MKSFLLLLTIPLMIFAIIESIWRNHKPQASVSLIKEDKGKYFIVKSGPGWPMPSYYYEIYWWGSPPEINELLRNPLEDESISNSVYSSVDGRGVAGLSGHRPRNSRPFNFAMIGAMIVSLLLNICYLLSPSRKRRNNEIIQTV